MGGIEDRFRGHLSDDDKFRTPPALCAFPRNHRRSFTKMLAKVVQKLHIRKQSEHYFQNSCAVLIIHLNTLSQASFQRTLIWLIR